jgi:hypothetical protein
VRAGAPTRDAISEAQWPVVERTIRTQFNMLLNWESAKDWTIGSGLLMFGTFREMNRLVEEIRENDITVGVDCSDWRRSENGGESRFSWQVILGGLLVFFLMGLQWGSVAPAPWSLVLKVLAISALPAMFWVISRIG